MTSLLMSTSNFGCILVLRLIVIKYYFKKCFSNIQVKQNHFITNVIFWIISIAFAIGHNTVSQHSNLICFIPYTSSVFNPYSIFTILLLLFYNICVFVVSLAMYLAIVSHVKQSGKIRTDNCRSKRNTFKLIKKICVVLTLSGVHVLMMGVLSMFVLLVNPESIYIMYRPIVLLVTLSFNAVVNPIIYIILPLIIPVIENKHKK